MGPTNKKSKKSTVRSRARANPHARALNALTTAEADSSITDTRRKGKGKGKRAAPPPSDDKGEDEDEDYDDPNVEEGSDDEGNKWTVGKVASDDDSELDSDEAMGSSDEEKFADFTFRGSSTRKGNGGEDEDEEDEEDWGEEEGGEDLLAILDRRVKEEEEEERGVSGNGKKGSKSKKRKVMEEEEVEEEKEDFGGFNDDEEDGMDESDDIDSSEDGSEEDSGDDDDDSMTGLTSDSDSDADETTDPNKLSALYSILTSLPTTTTSDAPRVKRPRLQDPNEVKPPSEYNITSTSSQKLTLGDLLPTLDSTLKSSLKPLLEDSTSTTASGVLRKLTAPLPKRQQDRLDRSVAYGKTKEELGRWTDTVKHNREAAHLHFPLVDPDAGCAGGGAGARLVAANNTAPLTALEATISNILKESGLSSEKEIAEFESLKANKLSVEEEQRRRAQLRMARELMYREEIRAKRIKKIKSKTYRRIHKKDRERLAAAEAALNGDTDEELDEEERERRRAEERMSLRHKQSRWAKGLRESGRGMWDEEARDDAVEMVRRGEELRRRIRGKSGAVDGEDESEEEESDYVEEGGEGFDEEAAQRRKLLKELDGVGQDGLDKDEGTSMGRLMQMKFMQKAQAARRKENEETMAMLREDLEHEERGSGASDEEGEEEAEEIAGRRSFKPVRKKGKDEAPKPMQKKRVTEDGFRVGSDEEVEEEEQELEFVIDIGKRKNIISKNPFSMPGAPSITTATPSMSKPRHGGLSARQPSPERVSANPWTTAAVDNSRLRSSVSTTVSASDSKTAKANAKLSRERRAVLQAEQALKESVADEDVLVSTDISMLATAPNKGKEDKKPAAATAEGPSGEKDSSDDSEAEDDESNTHLIPSSGRKNPLATQHRELVRRAFAGDDVQAEFQDDKDQEVGEDETKEVDGTLPGWGSWSGAGINESKKRAKAEKRGFGKGGRFTKVVQGVDKEKRKDAKLEKVIISEKKVKKNIKYQATSLPFPFETKAQYERALRLPIGKEWSTKTTFQEATMPRVMVKRGTVVEPMRKPLK
ncbi:Utp14-domain-containing protein [Terfezia boudieri ATCC MYA-4762]|uniref:Utp14-domain-containing protein n=1 Tax=Terfezia boudieri ATCC MYA-4762 TaxID=1051890 RepID=A0A3N4LFA0_9PEZI|nr:Utp14-domain-containing protein [Terfezia boudieri ATCC MYA-4762]